jgi:hypothetical protein
VIVCLLKNEPATYRLWQVKEILSEAKVKASLKRAVVSQFVDPNPGDLTMSRMKLG